MVTRQNNMPVGFQKEEIGCGSGHLDLRSFIDHKQIKPLGRWLAILMVFFSQSTKLLPSSTSNYDSGVIGL